MSVYRPKDQRTFVYDFVLGGRRYKENTKQTTRRLAEEVEAIEKQRLRRRLAGLEANAPEDTPTFTEWAAVTFAYQCEQKGLKRPDAALGTLRQVLAFWGTRPTETPAVEDGEYRDLRLGDPIAHPELLADFEAWMSKRGLSGPRKNQYRSACSMIYRVALKPHHRRTTGVRENPFANIERDRPKRRTATLTPQDIVAWMKIAPPAVTVGVALGALAPALRLRNVVELRRDEHVDARLEYVTVPHKADRETGAPLTIAISPELRRILKDVYKAHPTDPYVVPLGDRPKRARRKGDGWRYHRFGDLVQASMIEAGLAYGRGTENGVTFHSLRHSLATWMARWGVPAHERQRTMGHATAAMTAWYSHFGGSDTVGATRMIGSRLRLATTVRAKFRGPTVSHTVATGRVSRGDRKARVKSG